MKIPWPVSVRFLPTGDNRISFVVKSTAEDFIRMSFQDLFAFARQWIPDATGLVGT